VIKNKTEKSHSVFYQSCTFGSLEKEGAADFSYQLLFR